MIHQFINLVVKFVMPIRSLIYFFWHFYSRGKYVQPTCFCQIKNHLLPHIESLSLVGGCRPRPRPRVNPIELLHSSANMTSLMVIGHV